MRLSFCKGVGPIFLSYCCSFELLNLINVHRLSFRPGSGFFYLFYFIFKCASLGSVSISLFHIVCDCLDRGEDIQCPDNHCDDSVYFSSMR